MSRVALLLCLLLCVSAVAAAQPALDKPAFTATPAELLALAKQVAGEPHDSIVLRDDVAFTVDGKGGKTRRVRRVVVVLAKEGVRREEIEARWIPHLHDMPRIQARVVTPDGKVHTLDPKVLAESPGASEQRFLVGKLPNVVVGSVIEMTEESVTRRRRVDAGELLLWGLGDDSPVLSTRISLAMPAQVQPKVATLVWPKHAKLSRATANHQQTWRYEIGRIDPVAFEDLVPGDVAQRPYLAVSTAASWQAVARSYRALVERRIAEGGIALPNDLRRAASVESAQAIVTWLHARVKPNRVSLYGSSLAPSSIADVVKRGTADAKELATVLVALLRQSGIRADVALLTTGPGRDVVATAPGVELFEHAIVRAQIGTREVWIDPVAELARVGQLPARAQGRLALVIADTTTALVKTPKSRSADNLVREVRTYELSKVADGRVRVTEVSREGGAFEFETRVEHRNGSAKEIADRLREYASSEYGGTYERHTTSPPADLAKPFEITLVVGSASDVETARDKIEVTLAARDALGQSARTPDDDEPVRKHDFEWVIPHVYEIENRLVLPPGYLPPQLPPDRTRKLGPATLVETQRLDGRTVVVTFRFDSGKVRITAAELAAYHAEAARVYEEQTRIVIDHEAWSLANAGKYRPALDAVDALIKAHPKDGVHHQQRAFVLLSAGLGTAASRAARKAVELEPTNADMHVFAGWVLRHDRFGREWGPGYDRAGALAAFARARKLDPKHAGANAEQAMVLERDPSGRAYEAGSDMRGAIAAWREAYKLDPSYGYQLTLALAITERYAEAATVAAKLERTPQHDAIHVATIAASSSPTAALAKLNSLATGSARPQLLDTAAKQLYWMRRYDLARTLSPVSSNGTPTDHLLQNIARKPMLQLGRDPGTTALVATLVAFDPGAPDATWDRQTRDELLREELAPDPNATAQVALVTRGFMHDAVRLVTPTVAGRPSGPWRVELDAYGKKSTLYVAPDRGVARVIGSPRALAGVGRHALRLVAANDLAGAAQLLDWLHADPMNAAWISKFWPSGKQNRAAIELAAAILADGTTPAAIQILTKCDSTLAGMRDRCDSVIAAALERANRWPELDAHVKQWLPRARDFKGYATYLEIIAAARVGRYDQADQLAASRLAADPSSESSIQAYARVALLRGRTADAVARLEPLLHKSPPAPTNLNNIAWFRIALGDHAKALELARKAIQNTPTASSYGTLATVEAELGHLRDAKVHQYDAFERLRTTDSAGLYVFGRIAEQLGLRDDAIALYKSVAPQPDDMVTPHDFAQKRLKALGAKP